MYGEMYGTSGGHDPWAFSMEQELQRWRSWNYAAAGGATTTIHRVPPSMRVDPSSVEPSVVSIGPYHRGKAWLQPMEQHKWSSLAAVLDLNRSPTMGDYLREMAAMEARARSCYSDGSAHMGSQEFVSMLLLDACFLAVAFLPVGPVPGPEPGRGRLLPRWWTPAVVRDVLLLENQVPFFVVQKVAELACPGAATAELPKRVGEALRDVLGLHASVGLESAGFHEHHHLLHLLHSLFFRPVFESEAPKKKKAVRSSKKVADGRGGSEEVRTMLSLVPSASELQDAGVKLKKREQSGLLNATFNDVTMQVPFLRLDHHSASLLQNLVAWEGAHADAGHEVTAYVLLMDRLVRASGDVKVLSEKGIVEHRLGGDGEAAQLFHRLCSGIPLELDGGGCYLKPSLLRLRKYQKSNLNKWKAWIRKEFSENEEFYMALLLGDVN